MVCSPAFPPADGTSRPSPEVFDRVFALAASSPGIARLWARAYPDLPSEVEPLSFVSSDLLRHVARALCLSRGQDLTDLGCGRGGPGLWLARELDVGLTGVDFSPVAVEAAARRAARFGRASVARFKVGELSATGLPPASADAVVCVDAFQFAADPGQAAAEVLRILRPGGRFVLTGWQPAAAGDTRLPPRLRIDWAPVLREAGLADVRVAARTTWHEAYTRVFRTALELGDPGDDTALAELQDEAREQLPTADLVRRVVVTATAFRPTPSC
jgi:SAM-dependent methyltransferase